NPVNNYHINGHGHMVINNNFDRVTALPDHQPLAGEPGQEAPLVKSVNDPLTVQKSVNWMQFGAYIWLAGVILMLMAIGFSYRRIYRQILRNTVQSDHLFSDLAQRCIAESGVKRKIAVRRVSEFRLPFVFGFFKPEIVIPAAVAEHMDEKGLKAILTHEMMHIKGQDHVIRLIILIVQSIHWFNPVLWFSFSQMMKDCEAACDAVVIKEYSESMRREYASVLLDMAQKQNKQAGFNPVIAFGKTNLKRRVTDIMNFRKYSVAAITASIIVLIVLSATILTGATNSGGTEPPGLPGGINTSAAGNIEVEALYENDKFGFSLLIPKDFMDTVAIKETDNCIYFVIKEFQATMPEHIFGVVGRIEIYDKGKFTKEIIQAGEDVYNLRYLGENDKYYFGWAHGTDVQVPTQQLIEEHRAMEDKFNEIIKTFKIIDIYGVNISIDHPEQILSFIKNYDEKTRVLTFDEIEWVKQTDTKRVGELGLNADLDFPNGYYIHNESEQENSLKVSNDVKVYVVNWHEPAKPSLTDIKGLTKRIAEYKAPYHLTIKDGVIIEILEQYRP
ncbi:MAG: M56 family metallopeptidase, partial [Desulfotomaculaceae bacterium]|nr:M56 family metallopeptidase [Desulfotomaculaceae bacterium]